MANYSKLELCLALTLKAQAHLRLVLALDTLLLSLRKSNMKAFLFFMQMKEERNRTKKPGPFSPGLNFAPTLLSFGGCNDVTVMACLGPERSTSF